MRVRNNACSHVKPHTRPFLFLDKNNSIGIPYAIRNAGIVAGVLLLLLVSYMTDKSLRILIELANYHPKLKNLGVRTFEDLMSIPFGRAGTLFVLVNMYVLRFCFFVWRGGLSFFDACTCRHCRVCLV